MHNTNQQTKKHKWTEQRSSARFLIERNLQGSKGALLQQNKGKERFSILTNTKSGREVTFPDVFSYLVCGVKKQATWL